MNVYYPLLLSPVLGGYFEILAMRPKLVDTVVSVFSMKEVGGRQAYATTRINQVSAIMLVDTYRLCHCANVS